MDGGPSSWYWVVILFIINPPDFQVPNCRCACLSLLLSHRMHSAKLSIFATGKRSNREKGTSCGCDRDSFSLLFLHSFSYSFMFNNNDSHSLLSSLRNGILLLPPPRDHRPHHPPTHPKGLRMLCPRLPFLVPPLHTLSLSNYTHRQRTNKSLLQDPSWPSRPRQKQTPRPRIRNDLP